MDTVIFDMDGVIFDSESLWQKAFSTINKEYDIGADENYRISLCGCSESQIRDKMKKDFPNLNVEKYREALIDKAEELLLKGDGLQLKKGFIELIEFLKSKKMKIGLATGNSLKRTYKQFEKFNLNCKEIFDFIITGDDVLKAKPDPSIYINACLGLQSNPSTCYVVEDSPNGIIAAFNANCKPIMVIDIIKPTEDIRRLCDKIFNSLSEFKKYLEDN